MNIYQEIKNQKIKTKLSVIALIADNYFNFTEAEHDLKEAARESILMSDYKNLKLISLVLKSKY